MLTDAALLIALLIFARSIGWGAERLKLSPSVGEIAAGIAAAMLIGSFGTGAQWFGEWVQSDSLHWAAEAGIFFLVLTAGIELQPRELAEASGRAVAVATGGILLPLIGGFALAWWFLDGDGLRGAQALLVGTVLSVTALPVTVAILMELGALHRPFGRTVVAAALFDDIIGLFLLAILSAIVMSGGLPAWDGLAVLAGKVLIFFAVTLILGLRFHPHLVPHLGPRGAVAAAAGILIAAAAGFGWLAEYLGIHWVIGPFMAGLFFEKSRVGAKVFETVRKAVEKVTLIVFGPIFFAAVGLQVDLLAVIEVPGFMFLLLAVAFASKIIGAGTPALVLGASRMDAAAIGICMNARGAVGLVVLSVAEQSGILNGGADPSGHLAHIFSALVLVVVVTTLTTPILLRLVVTASK